MIAAEPNKSITGVTMLLAAVTMFFAAFTSAMIVRRGLSGDWITTPLPGILWVNTAVLLASSLLLIATVRQRYAAMALGVLFVLGQLEAWRELSAAGIYLPTNPSAAFFYVLTAAHAVHVLGGLAGLQFANRQAAAVYWHFMTGLWVYVLFLFFIWG